MDNQCPHLVYFGLGDDLSDLTSKVLLTASIEDVSVRLIVGDTVEILSNGFWSAAERDTSFNSLNLMIRSCVLKERPVLTPLKSSVCADVDCWGGAHHDSRQGLWGNSVVYV